jgi:hypothetical protein
MFKRIGVALLGAMLGVAVVAGPASSAPEPRFTLTIDPTEGPVGTNIHAQLPAEATTPGGPCVSADALVAGIQSLVGNLIGQGPGSLPTGIEKTLAGLTNTDSIRTSIRMIRTSRGSSFASCPPIPRTQQPAIDQTTGQASETSFWDPDTGKATSPPPPPSAEHLLCRWGLSEAEDSGSGRSGRSRRWAPELHRSHTGSSVTSSGRREP